MFKNQYSLPSEPSAGSYVISNFFHGKFKLAYNQCRYNPAVALDDGFLSFPYLASITASAWFVMW